MKTLYQVVDHACENLLSAKVASEAQHEHLLAALPATTGYDPVSARRVRILRAVIEQHRESSVEVLTAVVRAIAASFTAEAEDRLEVSGPWQAVNIKGMPFDPKAIERIQAACGLTSAEQVTVARDDLTELLSEAARMAYAAEDAADPTYCVTCNSCGEAGCCPPENCLAVRCLYGEDNLASYKMLLDENEQLREVLIAIHKQIGGKGGEELDTPDLLAIPEKVAAKIQELMLSSPLNKETGELLKSLLRVQEAAFDLRAMSEARAFEHWTVREAARQALTQYGDSHMAIRILNGEKELYEEERALLDRARHSGKIPEPQGKLYSYAVLVVKKNGKPARNYVGTLYAKNREEVAQEARALVAKCEPDARVHSVDIIEISPSAMGALIDELLKEHSQAPTGKQSQV